MVKLLQGEINITQNLEKYSQFDANEVEFTQNNQEISDLNN